jgi:hypothetical protein
MKDIKIGQYSYHVEKVTAGDVARTMKYSASVDAKGNLQLDVGEHWLRLLSFYVKYWEDESGEKIVSSYDEVGKLEPVTASILIADMRKECFSGDTSFLNSQSSLDAPTSL